MKRRTMSVAVAAATMGASALTGVGTANAYASPGCIDGQLCFYYGQNETGAVVSYNDPYNPDMCNPAAIFPANGTGSGQYVCDNSASVYNTHHTGYARIWYSRSYGGASQTFNAQVFGNLNTTMRNNNRSFYNY